MIQSHAYAEKLKELAEFLLSRPDVQLGSSYGDPLIFVSFGSDKEPFIAAVRALLPGKKEIGDFDVTFKPTVPARFHLSIHRGAVCRKIQDVKYECEPLLSPEDEAKMETEDATSDIPV